MFYKLRWLREIGIFLLTVSILYLPFFRQRGPGINLTFLVRDYSPNYAGALLFAFACFWVVYLLSRTLSERWSFLILLPFTAASFLYLYSSIYHIFRPLGEIPMLYWKDYSYDIEIGMWLSGCGAGLLLIGVYATQTNRSPLRWGLLGALGGFVLFVLPSPLYLFLEETLALSIKILLCPTLPMIGMVLGVVFRIWLSKQHSGREPLAPSISS